MRKHKSQKGTASQKLSGHAAEAADPAEEVGVESGSEASETAEPQGDGGGASSHSPVELPDGAIQRLQEELNAQQDLYLRLAAEFDNFKKRSQRERSEAWSRAQAHVVGTILEVLDDLARVAHLDAEKTASQDVLAGVELVERKLVRQLEAAGLERVGEAGTPFDPNQHEAVTTVPAPAPEQDHHVAQVFQAGYRFGGGLLRPARVAVYMWTEGAGEDGSRSHGGGSGTA